MPTTNVSAGIKLTALVDGTTLQGMLLSTKPLSQGFKEADKGVVIPDFEKNPGTRPVVYLLINDTATGIHYSNQKIGNIKWYYNQTEILFDGGGLSTNFPGLFKKTTYAKNNVTVPAIEVQKNFPQFGNYDNDIISVEASIEMNGAQMWVRDISIPVVVQPISGGNVYSIQLNDKYGFTIPKDTSINQTETTASLLIDGVEASAEKIQELGVKFIFEKMVGGSAVVMPSSGNRIVVKKDDINNVLVVRCRAVDKSGKELASVYQSYTDSSDPYLIAFVKTDRTTGQAIEGTTVRRGQVAVIKPEIRSRNPQQTKYTGKVDWSFFAYNNNGEAYDGSPSITINADNCEVSYEAIVAADMNMNIVVEATL